MANLIKGPLSSRPVNAPAGTLFWDQNTNITYVYDDATWVVYPGETRPDGPTKAEFNALKARVTALENAVVCTVTFDSDGGSSVSPQTVAYGGKATEPSPAPTKTDKVFAGWFNGAAATAYNFNTAVKAPLTLTAHWTDAETE